MGEFFYKQVLVFRISFKVRSDYWSRGGGSSGKDLDRILVSVESARRSCFGIETYVEGIFIVGLSQ